MDAHGLESGAALATVVGVLEEVPIMLSLVWIANKTRSLFTTKIVFTTKSELEKSITGRELKL